MSLQDNSQNSVLCNLNKMCLSFVAFFPIVKIIYFFSYSDKAYFNWTLGNNPNNDDFSFLHEYLVLSH